MQVVVVNYLLCMSPFEGSSLMILFARMTYSCD